MALGAQSLSRLGCREGCLEEADPGGGPAAGHLPSHVTLGLGLPLMLGTERSPAHWPLPLSPPEWSPLSPSLVLRRPHLCDACWLSSSPGPSALCLSRPRGPWAPRLQTEAGVGAEAGSLGLALPLLPGGASVALPGFLCTVQVLQPRLPPKFLFLVSASLGECVCGTCICA